jgi:hypothetical protein
MSDQQVGQMLQEWQTNVAKRMDELKIRQWCIDKSIEFQKAGNGVDAFVIFKFITAPFADMFGPTHPAVNPPEPPTD